MQDTPNITQNLYSNSSIDLSKGLMWGGDVGSANVVQDWATPALEQIRSLEHRKAVFQRVQQAEPLQFIKQDQPQQQKETQMASRRIVQVFIADPDPNAPLEESVLYTGTQKLTDLNDMELYFEVPMAETLKAYNEKRVTWLDKEATKRAGKDVHLEPVKIRDLKMVVVTVAQF